jgi:hypothetical protein
MKSLEPGTEAGTNEHTAGIAACYEAPSVPSGALRLALFGLLFFSYFYVHQDYTGGTSTSRLDLLHALVVDGTFHIDRYHRNTSDKAHFGGHYYSDKAPGTVLLALPGFLLAHWMVSERDQTHPMQSWRNAGWLEKSWLATVSSAGLITALGGMFFFMWLCRYVDQKTALITALALFLGAAPFPYATMLFSHALVAGLIVISLWLIERGQDRQLGNDRLYALAGFCAGLALASEFTAGIVIAGLFVFVALSGWRPALWFSMGAVPPLLLIPAYNWICFESPFTLGYSHQAVFPEMERGLYGIAWPDGSTALKLLFSPERGLLFWSPFFIMALFGYPLLWRKSRRVFWLALIIPIIQVVCISGYTWDWRAGWTLGPRYLSPVLPLLAVPAAFGAQRHPALGAVLIAASIALTGLGTLINATPRYEIANPLFELHLPGLIEGKFTYNAGQFLGLPGHWSMAPLFVIALFYGVLMRNCLKGINSGSFSK